MNQPLLVVIAGVVLVILIGTGCWIAHRKASDETQTDRAGIEVRPEGRWKKKPRTAHG